MSGRDLSGLVRQAVVEALKADPDVAALVGARIHDYVSAAPAYPLLRCTTMVATPWEATGGLHGSRVLVQVDAFAKGYGRGPIEPLVAAVVAALDEADLAISGSTLLSLQWRQTRTMDDPAEQGVTHGVVEFESIAAQ
jgi:hypothetical protein